MSLIFLFIITRLPVNFRVGRACLFIMLLLYGIITGFGVSCIRAVIMCGLKIMASLTGRTYDVISAISFAAIITLLRSPASLFQCDFILSYLAVTSIAVVYPVLERGLRARKNANGMIYNIIVKPLLFSVCVNITTLPVILLFYYDAALYSVVTGLIIIPLLSVLFVTGCLCAALGGIVPAAGMFLAGGIHYILSFYRVVCEWCVDNVYGMRITGNPGAGRVLVCYVIMAVLVCAAYGIKNRRTCVLLCAAFALLPVCVLNFNVYGGLKMTFLDVGQGDGIVMRMPDGKVVCVDGGSTDVGSLAKYRIEPYLYHEGIRHIDYWIITHMDNDHYSGLTDILARRRYNGIVIDNIIIADTEICRGEFFEVFSDYKFSDYKPAVIYMDDKDSLTFGGAVLQCLSPVSSGSFYSGTDCPYKNQNESSIVLALSYGNFDALLTGDIEGKPEEELNIDIEKEYEMLKVAHHGSKNSTSGMFLGKLKCRNAVISYGKDNRYGHPHRETVERLRMRGMHVYKTAESGAVTVSVGKDGFEIEEYN
ncbi:MAG: MBL fold metallo-hydrolase [Lachnospiraceae bacterium]|nr:MBL fold metallo-hydrolase [Lachnospiraceae bacterium]